MMQAKEVATAGSTLRRNFGMRLDMPPVVVVSLIRTTPDGS